jgi:alpha-D-ribose 1-methylphosphonate 5-triphosphate synthase subunit PhnG
MLSQTLSSEQLARQDWLNTLAHTPEEFLEEFYHTNFENQTFTYLREPEIGLVMVRARAGGSGKQFNLGEVSVARCSVALDAQTVGHGYVKGRSKRHAELIALIDANFQKTAPNVEFLKNLKSILVDQQEKVSRKAAATKVDFYTMVRGED